MYVDDNDVGWQGCHHTMYGTKLKLFNLLKCQVRVVLDPEVRRVQQLAPQD